MAKVGFQFSMVGFCNLTWYADFAYVTSTVVLLSGLDPRVVMIWVI